MPVTVNTSIQGLNDMTAALVKLQTFLGQTVSVAIDNQSLANNIIALQTFLSTVATVNNPPVGFKFDPAKINRYILDQHLSGKIIDLQNAANLT
jgi:hypothetical protein